MKGADVEKVEELRYLGSPSKEMDNAQGRWKKMVAERVETKLEISTSEGQHRLSIFETKLERRGTDGVEKCRGGIMALLHNGC